MNHTLRCHRACFMQRTRNLRAAPCRKLAAGARRSPRIYAAASSEISPPIKVVGCGSCGVDYLASVAAYPKPDEKLRTEELEVQGGGNCANALTAAARLGLSPVILTKIGGDGLGDGIISELKAEGVDPSFIIREPNHPSPFTYIIVDRQGGTRTCIHTPGAPLEPSEVPQSMMDELLAGASLVYFDGRLTEAAVNLATRARELGVPVLVEGERLRPNLEQLLPLADYVVTSAHFPQDWTGEQELGDAIVEVVRRLPNAKFVITTLGKQGALMLERPLPGEDPAGAAPLADLLPDLYAAVEFQAQQEGEGLVVLRSGNGVEIGAPSNIQTQECVELTFSEARDAAKAQASSRAAAERAAALNADASNADGYAMEGAAAAAESITARVTFTSAAVLPPDSVKDTTGAGDAFIGAVMYSIATGKSPTDMLRLAAVVAACKCTALGARPGLPRRSDLGPDLI